jgi:hypothetical protein
LGLRFAALQRGFRQARRQPHQLAVVNPGVSQQIDRPVFRIQPPATALDDDQGPARIRTRRSAGEILDQRVQRAERQFSALPAGPDHRSHQTDAAGGDAQARPGPRQGDGVIDLGPFDHDIRIVGIADADAADEAVDLDPLHLDIGRNPALVQPADQDIAGHSTAIEIDQGGHHADQQRQDQNPTATARRMRRVLACGFGLDGVSVKRIDRVIETAGRPPWSSLSPEQDQSMTVAFRRPLTAGQAGPDNGESTGRDPRTVELCLTHVNRL